MTDNTEYGNRPDGSKKGRGFLGILTLPGGKGVASEYSVGVNIDGQEIDIPTLVPTLSKDEVRQVLEAAETGSQPPLHVVEKAIDHARIRIKNGLSPFAD